MNFELLNMFLNLNKPFKITFTSRPESIVMVIDYRRETSTKGDSAADTIEFVGKTIDECLKKFVDVMEF